MWGLISAWRDGVDFDMADFYVATFERVFYVAMVCTAFELAFPASRYSLRSRVRGVVFFLVALASVTLIWAASTAAFAALGLKPLFTFNIGQLLRSDNQVFQAAGAVVAGVVVTMIGDFFYYWFHRLQHAVPLMWRFHAVHHSIREMSAWNCNHHVAEDLMRLPFVTLPLVLFQFDSGVVPAVALALIAAQPTFEHSCMKLHLGPLRYVFGDPRFHRLHHSIERQHWDANFGSFTTIWDQLFRTAKFPKKGEWPEVGLEDQPEPQTIREFVLRPFQRSGRALDLLDATQRAEPKHAAEHIK